MGFFEQQERARRLTARLLVLYALSVLAIVACANLVVVPVYVLWFDARVGPGVYAVVSLGTLAVIAAGSIEILARLSLGEAELATLLAGRRVSRGSGNPAERRLINVVDEMAIASGLAAPPVYVLGREDGINAFAAGRSPNQAIVVVTRGALERLTRDELQAVVAHEFSHILNGDIRLNLRTACVLQGIVFLSAIGRFMMRYYSGYGTPEGRRMFHLPLAVVGGGLFVIGSVGLLCARMIQGAIAREREYLSDACAVQYTRNADALCYALARIRGHGPRSRLLNWHADAIAHMLFAAPMASKPGGLFATHPPLEERMRRANPHVAPQYYFEHVERRKEPPAATEAAATGQQEPAPSDLTIVPRRATAVAALIASIGEPDADMLEHAGALLSYLPASLREALGEASGAQAVLLGCLIDAEASARERQLRALGALGKQDLARKAEVLAPLVRQLDRAYRLPLVALALPVLRKELDKPSRAGFLAAMRAVIEADARLTLDEFVLDTLLDWNLGPKARRAGGVRYEHRAELSPEVTLIFSLLAHAGTAAPEAAQEAFARGAAASGLEGLTMAARASLQLGAVSDALERLSQLAPLEKPPLLAAFGEIIAADANVRLAELELLRAVAAVMDCPMPPALRALDPRLLRK